MRFKQMSKKEAKFASIARRHNIERAFELSGKRNVYRNNTKGTLTLPKPSFDGKLFVEPNDTWEGDESYMYMVQSSNEAKLVSVSTPTQEVNTMPEKLILDQPDTVTTAGKVEHVLVTEPTVKKLNEETPTPNPTKEVLLTEDPMEGLEIIMND